MNKSEESIMAMNLNREKDYKWRKNNLKRFEISLNIKTDKDIVEKLESVDNKRAYIIDLIRKDINGK